MQNGTVIYPEQITSYEALAPELDALLKRRLAANYAPERQGLEAEIAAGLLWGAALPEGLVLLQRGSGPQRLRFLLTEAEALLPLSFDRTTVLELPFRRGDPVFLRLAEALKSRGWTEALGRVRLTRRAAPCPAVETSLPGESPTPEALLGLLEACFSPLTGCLPEAAELEADLAAGRVLACGDGLLRWREKGRSREIRHLAVAPEARGRGLAKALVRGFLDREGDKLCRVWTGAENRPARRVYESFGFAPDGWESLVLVSPPPTQL